MLRECRFRLRVLPLPVAGVAAVQAAAASAVHMTRFAAAYIESVCVLPAACINCCCRHGCCSRCSCGCAASAASWVTSTPGTRASPTSWRWRRCAVQLLRSVLDRTVVVFLIVSASWATSTPGTRACPTSFAGAGVLFGFLCSCPKPAVL